MVDFEKMCVDYNVTEAGKKGMLLHIKFTVYDMLNMAACLAVYFEYANEKGGWLKDKIQKFNSSDGFVAVYKSIKPLYNPAVYNDLSVFMPCEEFKIEKGKKHELKLDADIIYKNGDLVKHMKYYDFWIQK